MTRSSTTTLVLILLLTGAGCKTQHVPYHSTASIPHYSMDIQTEMDLVVGNEDLRRSRDYVVIAAVDDGETPYVLLAPLVDGGRYEISDAILGRSAPLVPDHAEEFIRGLGRTLTMWSTDPAGEEGMFYEFIHAPEQDVVPVSSSVAEWTPSIRFTFSHTPEGPSARMMIGYHPEGLSVRVVEFEKQKEVADLKQLLEGALDRMNSMVAERARR